MNYYSSAKDYLLYYENIFIYNILLGREKKS